MTQNNKIIIAAVSIFFVSLSAILYWLESGGESIDHSKTNVLQTITEQGHGESEEADPETLLREEIDEYENPVFAIGTDGKFVLESENFCDLLERKCEDLEEKLLYSYINSQDLPGLVSLHTKIFENKTRIDGEGPYRMYGKGNEILVMFDIMPILDKDENVTLIVFAVKDITGQVQALQFVEEQKEDTGSYEQKEKTEDTTWLKENIYPRLQQIDKKEVVFHVE